MTQNAEGGQVVLPVMPLFLDTLRNIGVMALILFAFRQSQDWPAGWAYLGLYAAGTVANIAWLYSRNPELLLKRLNTAAPKSALENIFNWLLPACFAATLGVCALYPAAQGALAGMFARWCGFTGLAAAYALASCALAANRFAVKEMTIQPGQAVASTGPYAYVRHPLYASLILLAVCTPPALGSLYGYVPASALALAIMVRAFVEDRFLLRGLSGYGAYAGQVRWRVAPGLW